MIILQDAIKNMIFSANIW